MSYLLSWSIYLWDQLEGVCVEKNAPQEEVSTWIWYQQLFTQRRTFKKKMSPLQIERTRHTKVSAGIYYRQLFAKKENLQYKEMIEISRWSLDRSHPYGLWFIYWDPPKIQTSYIKRTGVLKTALQEGILVKPRTLSRTYQRGKNPPHDFPSVFPMISVPETCSSEYSGTFSEKKIDVDRLLWLLDTTSSLAWSQFIFNKNAFFFHN